MNWKGFLESVKEEPKNFVKAVIDNLDPPKYAIEELKKFDWMCDFCWKPRVGLCCLCQRSLCQEHIARIIIGEKTKLEWYFCPACVIAHDEKELLEKVSAEDEEFWLEDQEQEG